MTFIEEELHIIKTKIENEVSGLKLLSTSSHSVQVAIRKTDHKQLRLLIMFPESYPANPIIVEVKSKFIPPRAMTVIEKTCEVEAKKLQGQFQVIPICKVVRQFLEENMFINCAEELDNIKKRFFEKGDEIKIRQKSGVFILKVHKNSYFMNLKMAITDSYPLEQVRITVGETNFPKDLAEMFVRQSIEIARRCVVPPAIPSKGAPPFEPQASILPVSEYLVSKCIKLYPVMNCSICDKQAFPQDSKDVTQNIRDPKYVEYVYCSHIFHHKCLDSYMRTPPFKDGKKCPICQKQIFHEKWKESAEVLEQRWAHKQAKQRELAEVMDFMDL